MEARIILLMSTARCLAGTNKCMAGQTNAWRRGCCLLAPIFGCVNNTQHCFHTQAYSIAHPRMLMHPCLRARSRTPPSAFRPPLPRTRSQPPRFLHLVQIFDLMGYSPSHENKINIHMGGVYGSKPDTIQVRCRRLQAVLLAAASGRLQPMLGRSLRFKKEAIFCGRSSRGCLGTHLALWPCNQWGDSQGPWPCSVPPPCSASCRTSSASRPTAVRGSQVHRTAFSRGHSQHPAALALSILDAWQGELLEPCIRAAHATSRMDPAPTTPPRLCTRTRQAHSMHAHCHTGAVRAAHAAAVENDDVATSFSLHDLLELHRLTGIPLVFDFHHHRFCPGGCSVQARWGIDSGRRCWFWAQLCRCGSLRGCCCGTLQLASSPSGGLAC